VGIGDWGLEIGPNPQSPIPNPQKSEVINKIISNYNYCNYIMLKT